MASTFRIIVQIDPKGAQLGAKQVEGSLNRVGRAATRTSSLIARAFSVAVIAAGITSAIRTLASFSQEMSTVRAVTGATEEDFKRLSDEAQRLGSTTRFTATQAAEGMTFLARAGFEVTEVLASVGDTLNLAQAGALDLASAADITSNVIQGFQLSASDATRVVDVLALTANSANTDVLQLGQAMSFLAPAAKAVGVDVELAAASIAALSDAGIQSTRAGTGLRQIFIQLEKAGGDLSIQNNGLIGVLETLRDRNLSLADAAELVGARQAAGLLVLLDSIDKIKGLDGALENAAGTAEKTARIMDDNLNGALLAVNSAIEGFILGFGKAGATGILQEFFQSLATGIRAATANINDFLKAFDAIAPIIAFRLALVAVIATVRALTIAIATNPIGFLLTLVTTAIALVISFKDEIIALGGAFPGLSDSASAALSLLSDGLSFVGDAIVSILPGVESLGEIFDDVAGLIDSAIAGIVNGVDFLVAAFAGGKAGILQVFSNFPVELSKLFLAALNAAIAVVEEGVRRVINLLNLLPKVDIQFEGFGRIDEGILPGPSAIDTATAAFEKQRGAINGLFEDRKKFTQATRELISEEEGYAAALSDAEKETAKLKPTTDETTTSTKGLGEATEETANALNSLLASVSPLVAAEQQLTEAQTTLNNALKAGLITEEQAAETLRRVRREVIGVGNAETDFLEKQQLLNEALRDGVISGAEFNKAMMDLSSTAQKEGDFIGDALGSAFQKAGDALGDFVTTGKLDFKGLVDSIFKDITKLATNNLFGGGQGQGGGLLGGLFGGGGNQQGGGLLGGLFGGGGSPGGGGLFGGLGSLFGFANGGSFDVGGNAGRDRNVLSLNNQPVARVSKGETVNVSNGGERPVQVIFNVQTPDAESFKRSQGQLMAQAISGLNRANRRNN